MKNSLSFILLFTAVFNAFALHPLKSSEINDPNLNKEVCWETVKYWVASNLDSRNAYIAYENWDLGKMLIKGEYRDNDSRLQSVENDFVRPYVSYEIEVNCSEGHFKIEFTKVNYKFKSWAGNAYSLDEYTIKRCHAELDEIINIMKSKGDVWEYDYDYFKQRNEKLSAEADEAKKKSEDKSLKKKQRKQYVELWAENSSKSFVSSSVSLAVHKLIMCKSSLYDAIKSTIEIKEQEQEIVQEALTFHGYKNIKAGFALEQTDVRYNSEQAIKGQFQYLLMTGDGEIIITSDQFDEKIRFKPTKKGHEGKELILINDTHIFSINLDDYTIIYTDLQKDKAILCANIDVSKTKELNNLINNKAE